MTEVDEPSIISNPMHGVLIRMGFQYKGPCPGLAGRRCAEVNGMYEHLDRTVLHIEIEGSKFELQYWRPNSTKYRGTGDGCEELANALITARTMHYT